tara:strand:+ start:18 stop:482 length:465 start_codon:yes stop_codon:yes gene_type:complete
MFKRTGMNTINRVKKAAGGPTKLKDMKSATNVAAKIASAGVSKLQGKRSPDKKPVAPVKPKSPRTPTPPTGRKPKVKDKITATSTPNTAGAAAARASLTANRATFGGESRGGTGKKIVKKVKKTKGSSSAGVSQKDKPSQVSKVKKKLNKRGGA